MPPKEKKSKDTSKSPSDVTKTKKTSTKTSQKNKSLLYDIEKILARKKSKKHGYLYKIKWQGHPESEASWEPRENLSRVPEMVEDFIKSLEEKGESSDESDNEEEEKGSEPNKKKEKTPKKEPKEKKKNKNPGSEKIPKPKKKLKTEKDTAPAQNIKPKYGHFQFNDEPEAILKGRKESDCLIFLVNWKARKDGNVPKPTEMTSLELRRYDKDLLLDYYESKLTFKHVKPPREEPEDKPDNERLIKKNNRIETENNEVENEQEEASHVEEEAEEPEEPEHVEEEAEGSEDEEEANARGFDNLEPAIANSEENDNENDNLPTQLVDSEGGSDENKEEGDVPTQLIPQTVEMEEEEEEVEIESPKEISDYQSNNENEQRRGKSDGNHDNVDELDFLASPGE